MSLCGRAHYRMPICHSLSLLLLHNVYNQMEGESETFFFDHGPETRLTRHTLCISSKHKKEGKETQAQDEFQETLSSIELMLLRFESTQSEGSKSAIEERGQRTLVSRQKSVGTVSDTAEKSKVNKCTSARHNHRQR